MIAWESCSKAAKLLAKFLQVRQPLKMFGEHSTNPLYPSVTPAIATTYCSELQQNTVIVSIFFSCIFSSEFDRISERIQLVLIFNAITFNSSNETGLELVKRTYETYVSYTYSTALNFRCVTMYLSLNYCTYFEPCSIGFFEIRINLFTQTQACIRRRIFHPRNLMLMIKSLCLSSFTFDLAHEKFDV